MLKVHIAPNWVGEKERGDGGIRRVSEAMIKHLPKFDVEFVSDPNSADVLHTHGGEMLDIPGIPMINTNHGLYWSRYPWGDVYHNANKDCVENMRRAVAHTAVSEWVRNALVRGMLVYPKVIYHGIDAEDWPISHENDGYILWNKARADFVSNPHDMNTVAQYLRQRYFKSTCGQPAENVQIIGGEMPFPQMKKVIAGAGVYLSTARETFGIGTLEALCCGIPVAGWDWGGNSEIIIHGETGYLAKPGNYEELADCIEKCFMERERLSRNAAADARKRWKWEPRIKQYADLYKKVYRRHNRPGPKVAVVVSAYYLDKYLDQCLQSVTEQTFDDFECLVIDDALSDDTKEIVSRWTEKDRRIQYVRPPRNLGLPELRNYSLRKTDAKYIRHLDADDWLAPNALELEAYALDQNWGIHIAYGHLAAVYEDGSPYLNNDGSVMRGKWPFQFSWRAQMAHLNQLPSCLMARREVFENVGGYRRRMWRNEDADFNCRVTSLGFRAVKITEAVTYYHRTREDSKGAVEWKEHGGEGDWTAWFPWRMGFSSFGDAKKGISKLGKGVPDFNIVPFGAQGEPPPGKKFWQVHDYAYPNVAVIVTCGPGHEKYLQDALDSVLAQTYPDWECIVVNDTGWEWPNDFRSPAWGFPWAKIISTEGNKGASRARNFGAEHISKSVKAIVWLDADDYWLPWFLEKTVAVVEQNNGIIFTDTFLNDGPGHDLEKYEYPEFECGRVIKEMRFAGSSVLVPRWIHEQIVKEQGGWDESIPGMEDWDYQFAAQAIANACAFRVDEPLFVYRRYTSTKREVDYAKIKDIVSYMDAKWTDYRVKGKKMGCGCSSRRNVSTPKSRLSSTGVAVPMLTEGQIKDQVVFLEYHGPHQAAHTVRGKVTGRGYRFGLDKGHKIRPVYAEDAELFLQIRKNGVPMFTISAPPNKENDPAGFLDKKEG